MKRIERAILRSKTVHAVREHSKRLFLPGFEGLHLHEVFTFFLTQIKREGLNVRAAAISFNIVMAIPAASIFLFTLVPYIPAAKNLQREIMDVILQITPDRSTQQMVSAYLDDFFNTPKTGLLSLGFILAMFYSSNAMMGIIRSFDRSLLRRAETNFIEKRLRAIKLTLILVLLIIGTALISAGQGLLFNNIMNALDIQSSYTKFWIQLARWVIVIALFLFAIAFIYKFAPSVHERWTLLSPGAILATVLMVSSTTLFSLWAQNFSNYDKFYGSIGTLIILMTLIFINSLVLLIGYELNVSISHLKTEADEKEDKAGIASEKLEN